MLVVAPAASAKDGSGTSATNRAASWGAVTGGVGLSGNEGLMVRGALDLNVLQVAQIEGYSFNSLNVNSQVQGEGVRALFYLGNSFYVAGGYERRRIFQSNWLSFDGTDTRDDIRDRGVTYSLGNRWHWSTFTLGVDWWGAFKRTHLDSSTRNVFDGSDRNAHKLSSEPYDGASYFASDTRFLQLQLGIGF